MLKNLVAITAGAFANLSAKAKGSVSSALLTETINRSKDYYALFERDSKARLH